MRSLLRIVMSLVGKTGGRGEESKSINEQVGRKRRKTEWSEE